MTECISIGTYSTLTSNNEITEVLDKEGNKIPQEPTFDPLFKAAQLTLMRHMNNIINLLPCPHQVILYDSDSSSKQTRYREKIEDLFMDTPWLEMVFSLTVSLNNYLVSISSFPWQPEVPTESHCDICRFCVLCTEVRLNYNVCRIIIGTRFAIFDFVQRYGTCGSVSSKFCILLNLQKIFSPDSFL